VVNPYEPDGSLAPLEGAPRFAAWARANEQALRKRHCAQRSGEGWYKTLDRIHPDLASRPKLLIPDIKGEPTVVLDKGEYYPHHNLYWITAESWDLRALATVLRSSVAVLFIASYCVRMAGGFLRFQAQYLRRICVPRWDQLSAEQQGALIAASDAQHLDAIDHAVALAFGLTEAERALARAIHEDARVPRKTHAAAAPAD
jgi:hypothetical protein